MNLYAFIPTHTNITIRPSFYVLAESEEIAHNLVQNEIDRRTKLDLMDNEYLLPVMVYSWKCGLYEVRVIEVNQVFVR